jgi:hypothetical protein
VIALVAEGWIRFKRSEIDGFIELDYINLVIPRQF